MKEAEYIKDIEIINPVTDMPVTLEIWKDPLGGFFAVEPKIRVSEVTTVTSVYDSGRRLSLYEP